MSFRTSSLKCKKMTSEVFCYALHNWRSLNHRNTSNLQTIQNHDDSTRDTTCFMNPNPSSISLINWNKSRSSQGHSGISTFAISSHIRTILRMFPQWLHRTKPNLQSSLHKLNLKPLEAPRYVFFKFGENPIFAIRAITNIVLPEGLFRYRVGTYQPNG